tara:strand:+ start:333 stop:575 length:243 start_codon:yes stop_codon:yes gene_type:complete
MSYTQFSYTIEDVVKLRECLECNNCLISSALACMDGKSPEEKLHIFLPMAEKMLSTGPEFEREMMHRFLGPNELSKLSPQ